MNMHTYYTNITDFEGNPVSEIIPMKFNLINKKQQRMLLAVNLNQAHLVYPGRIELNLDFNPSGNDDLIYEFHFLLFGRPAISRGYIKRGNR